MSDPQSMSVLASEQNLPILILVPTQMELDRLEEQLSSSFDDHFDVRLCGFGPIAAGVNTMAWISQKEYSRVLLLGIAGTYCPETLPIGSASFFERCGCYGIGAGQGDSFQSAGQLGFAQTLIGQPGCAQESRCFDELVLPDAQIQKGWPSDSVHDVLLTVCSSAANPKQVAERRERFPHAVAEDMEAFGAAMAAARSSVPFSVIRGISNVAGDRRVDKWQIDAALSAAAKLCVRVYCP